MYGGRNMWEISVPSSQFCCEPEDPLKNNIFKNIIGIPEEEFRTMRIEAITVHNWKRPPKTSLVAQWLRILLPMQGTQVSALVQKDPTCHGATKPVCHNYWVCALEPASHNYWACVPQLLKPVHLEPMLCDKRSHCNEKPVHHNEE